MTNDLKADKFIIEKMDKRISSCSLNFFCIKLMKKIGQNIELFFYRSSDNWHHRFNFWSDNLEP